MNGFLSWLSAVTIHLIGSTMRMTVEDRGELLDRPDRPPVIIAFWHNRTVLMAYFYERFNLHRTALTFISRSRDGQIIADVAARFGIKAVRGSSSRHGTSAMLSAVRAAQDRHIDLAITPDGPRGPRYEIRPGLIRLAQLTGRPIIAVNYRVNWKWELKSWDRFHVPLPFSRCRLITNEAIYIPDNASPEQLEAIRKRISDALGGD